VVWWLGALALVCAIFTGRSALVTGRNCDAALAEQAAWQKKVDLLAAIYSRMPPAKSNLVPEWDLPDEVKNGEYGSVDTGCRNPEIAAAYPLQCGRTRAKSEVPKSKGLDDAVAKCSDDFAANRALFAGILAVIGVALFALAYVVGGRFWLPPKAA
jgi:hypothetical protein